MYTALLLKREKRELEQVGCHKLLASDGGEKSSLKQDKNVKKQCLAYSLKSQRVVFLKTFQE